MNGLILIIRINSLHGVEIDGWILENDRSVLVVAVCYATGSLLKFASRLLFGYVFTR